MNFAKLPDGKYVNLDRVDVIGVGFGLEKTTLNFWFGEGDIEVEFKTDEEAEEWIEKNTSDQVYCGVDVGIDETKIMTDAIRAQNNREKKKEKGKNGK